jgi:hypothetical protein
MGDAIGWVIGGLLANCGLSAGGGLNSHVGQLPSRRTLADSTRSVVEDAGNLATTPHVLLGRNLENQMCKNCGFFHVSFWRDVLEKESDLPITCLMFLTCAALGGSRPKWVWGGCGLQKVSWGGEGEGLLAGRTWEAMEQVTIKLRGLRGVLSERAPRPESSTECCLTWK